MGGDQDLVDRLRAGDEQAFMTLVDLYHAPLLRLAASFVPSRAVAEEVVQDTWLGVVRGIDRFEGRSSLKTWLYRILVNRARTAGMHEHRHDSVDVDVATVDGARFDAGGGWSAPPQPWADEVEGRLDAAALWPKVREHLDELPESQRQVVVLRDIEGMPAAEVATLLGLSDVNQRVLLHRGRARLRGLIEGDLGWVG